MIDHKVTIRDRVVSTDVREVVQDSNEADRIILNLDSDWDGLDEVYIVLGKGDEKLVAPYNPEDPPTFPAELTITVVERVISVDDSELIQNNVRTDTITLNLDAEYDGLNVIVIFTKPNNINVQVAYNGQPVHIPGSVMELTGSVAVSVVGLDAEGETRAVTKAAPDTFQVVASGAYTGKISQDDVDLLGQILQAVSDAGTAITAAETATAAATNATSQATSAATSANQAASSANSAASSANSAATKANSAAVDAQNAYDTLAPYMATIDSCANILHKEVGPDSVVTADDAFPAKPVEMVVYGNTTQNLWANPSGTNNGVTVTANADGSITLSGTPTSNAWIYLRGIFILRPGSTYTFSVDGTVSNGDAGFYVDIRDSDNVNIASYYIGVGQGYGENKSTFTVPSNAASAFFGFGVNNASVSIEPGTYHVMLNEGATAEPWCPPGLNGVDDGGSVEIVTAGKNLLARLGPELPYTTAGITFSDNGDGGIRISGTASSVAYYNFFNTINQRAPRITSGTYVASLVGDIENSVNLTVGYFYDEVGGSYTPWLVTSLTGVSNTGSIDRLVYIRAFLSVVSGMTVDTVVYPQLELGSTATDYEPPNITTTSIDLQGHTLNALPDGTRDELHIDGGGNVVLEKRTQTVQLDGDADWERFESPFIGYHTDWQNFGGSPTGMTINAYADKLPLSQTVRNGLYSANPNGIHAYIRDPTFASDAAGVKTWMGANKPIAIFPLLETQTIDLGTITPPTMAAPNVTAYVADDTPAEIELDYVRDINVVVDRLEKKVAGLAVMEATNV